MQTNRLAEFNRDTREIIAVGRLQAYSSASLFSSLV